MLLKYFAARALIGALAAIVLYSAFSHSVAAQDRSRIWLGVGLGGAGRTDGAGGAAVMAQLAYQTRAHQFSLRAMGAADLFGSNADEFGEIGLLYGRTKKRPWGHASIAGGLALTYLSSCPRGQSSDCTTLGVPLTAEVAAKLARVLGVGVQGFVNVNPKSVYLGYSLFVQIGWLP
jgi:hypothetical protein